MNSNISFMFVPRKFWFILLFITSLFELKTIYFQRQLRCLFNKKRLKLIDLHLFSKLSSSWLNDPVFLLFCVAWSYLGQIWDLPASPLLRRRRKLGIAIIVLLSIGDSSHCTSTPLECMPSLESLEIYSLVFLFCSRHAKEFLFPFSVFLFFIFYY